MRYLVALRMLGDLSTVRRMIVGREPQRRSFWYLFCKKVEGEPARIGHPSPGREGDFALGQFCFLGRASSTGAAVFSRRFAAYRILRAVLSPHLIM